MEHKQVPIALTFADGRPMAIMHFDVVGRGDTLRAGAQWHPDGGGWWTRELTDENIFAMLTIKYRGADMPSGYRVIENADIPVDRTYRNALADDGAAIVHDMAKARNLHRDFLREARAPKLAALDVQFLKNLEEGKDQTAVAEQKKSLRDITAHPDIEAAATIEELKNVTLGLLIKQEK